MAQIEVKNLSFKYEMANDLALKNINLKVMPGEVVVLCGESGSGKSTLLRHLKSMTAPVGELRGEVLIEGKNIGELSKEDKLSHAKNIGFIMQNPDTQIVTDRVYHELAFGLENLGVDTDAIRLRVAECVEYFGIRDIFMEDTGKLSGGQKQLVNLASAMTLNPKILLLDEPTSQLDPIAAARFMETVKKINDELGVSVVITEHRLDMVSDFADKIVILEKGEIKALGSLEDVIPKFKNSEFKKLLPITSQIALEHNEIIVKNRDFRNWIKTKKIKKVNKPLKNIEDNYALELKSIYFRYEKNLEDVLSNLNMKVKKGEIYALLGGNGSGKTTALKVIADALKEYRGKKKIKGKIGYLPQDVQTLFYHDTVREELGNILNISQYSNWWDADILDKHPYDLSGGQQQKIGLLKVLNNKPEILLLDEPTKGIDAIQKEKLGLMLRDLAADGVTILMVSHDPDFCCEYANRCGLFFRGNIIADENSDEFFINNSYYTTTIKKVMGNIRRDVVKKDDIKIS